MMLEQRTNTRGLILAERYNEQDRFDPFDPMAIAVGRRPSVRLCTNAGCDLVVSSEAETTCTRCLKDARRRAEHPGDRV